MPAGSVHVSKRNDAGTFSYIYISDVNGGVIKPGVTGSQLYVSH